MGFRNLYFQSRMFRGFNRTDWRGPIEMVSEADLITAFRSAYDGDPPEPWFDDAIPCSLRPEAATEYLRTVQLPVTARDFLLSKLFQFLYAPLKIQNQLDKPKALPLRRKLEHWLDGLSQRAVIQLYRFDWFAFFHDSVALDRAALLEGLDAYLPQTQARLRRTPAMGRRGPPADIGSYKAVARAVRATSENPVSGSDDRLLDIADYLDERNVPTPEAWVELDPPATSWRSAVKSHRRRVGKLIRYRLEQWKQLRRREKQLRRGEPASRRA